MEETQYSKLLSDISPIDVVVKMGCNDVCPLLPSEYEEDWRLNDLIKMTKCVQNGYNLLD